MRFTCVVVFALLMGAMHPAPQAPGSGWATAPSPERMVKVLYWQLFDKTEVWTRLVPMGSDKHPIPVNLILLAILPGRVTLPAGPKHRAREITVLAQPSPLAVLPTPNPSLQVRSPAGLDFDFVRLGMATVPPPCTDCGNQPISAVIDIQTFDRIAQSDSLKCDIWGLTCELSIEDMRAIRALGRQVGIYR
jgi:hypothetical protein